MRNTASLPNRKKLRLSRIVQVQGVRAVFLHFSVLFLCLPKYFFLSYQAIFELSGYQLYLVLATSRASKEPFPVSCPEAFLQRLALPSCNLFERSHTRQQSALDDPSRPDELLAGSQNSLEDPVKLSKQMYLKKDDYFAKAKCTCSKKAVRMRALQLRKPKLCTIYQIKRERNRKSAIMSRSDENLELVGKETSQRNA